MNLPEQLPLIISIFYNSNSWNHLIDKVINPFLIMNYDEGLIKMYHIYLSVDRGDHIKLVTYNVEHRGKIKNSISLALTAFLLENPSESTTIEYPLENFFMNYPNNSVWFDQREPFNRFDFIEGLDIKKIRWHISKSFFRATEGEPIDFESIYTFIIYMSLGMIKTVYPNLNNAHIGVLNLITYIETHGDKYAINIFEESSYLAGIIPDDQFAIIDILKDIWSFQNNDQCLPWMKDWENNSMSFLNGSNFNDCFIRISLLIYQHMGYTSGDDIYLSLKLISSSFSHLLNKKTTDTKLHP